MSSKGSTPEPEIVGFEMTGSLGVSLMTKKENWLKPQVDLKIVFDGLPSEVVFRESCDLLWAKLEEAMSDHLDVLGSE